MLATSKGEWDEATSEHPCPACGKVGWCARKRDGDAHRCMRAGQVPAGMRLVKESDDGGLVFAPIDSTVVVAPRALASGEVERADAEHLDRIYRRVLGAGQTLTQKHREDLRRRGLNDAQIGRGMYRSLGRHRHDIMRAVEGLDVSGVPGFFSDDGKLRFGGAVGLLIPVFDEKERVIALSVRADEPKPGLGKYTWCSSKKRGGAGSGAPVHVPAGLCQESTDLVRITEGALKASIATALSGVLTIGVAGTASWRPVIELLRQMQVTTVRLAFDQDGHQKRHVAEQLQKFYRALVAAGVTVELEVWDADAAKGIDDALLAGEQITILTGATVAESIEATVRQAKEADTSPALAPEPTVATVGRSPDPRRFEATDVGNGQRFAAQHSHRVRYCHLWGKWMVYDGRRWKEDAEGGAQRLAKETARSILTEAHAEADETRRTVLAKWATKSQAAGSINAMLRLAESEPGIPVLPAALDANPWALNVLNGTINLRTGALRPHNAADMLTKIAPVEFQPEAGCPTWERVLLEAMAGRQPLVEFIQRAAGVSLVGQVVEHVLFFCHGAGANGKSVILNGMLDASGEYGMKASADMLLVKGTNGHPTELADLFGKRVVVAQEVDDGRRMAEALIKELTGGDRVRARRMREDFWEFQPSHTLWLAANHRPTVRGTDHGIWRRLRLIPFEVTIPADRQDKSLPDKLRAEASGILAWMVRGCLAWQRDGLGEPDEVKAATAEYREEMDTLGAFLEEQCLLLPTARAKSSQLYSRYREWAEASGEHILARRKFGAAISERGFERFTNNGVWYRGVGIKSGRNDGPTEG